MPDHSQQKELEHLTLVITHAVDVEAIIYLGSHLDSRISRSCFTESGLSGRQDSGYELLIVTAPGEKRQDGVIQDKIGNRCRRYAAVHVTLLDGSSFERRGREPSFFLAEALQKGLLLYHAGRISLPDPLPSPRREHFQEALTAWKASCKDALKLFRGAEFYARQHEPRLAVFMLHQAAERACAVAVFVFTGLHTKTHNLDRLLQYTRLFSRELWDLFPRSSPEETALFEFLQKAYTEARYNDQYRIGENELRVLLRRVGTLLGLTGTLCGSKLQALKAAGKAADPACGGTAEEDLVIPELKPEQGDPPPEPLGKFISNALKPVTPPDTNL